MWRRRANHHRQLALEIVLRGRLGHTIDLFVADEGFVVRQKEHGFRRRRPPISAAWSA